MMFFMGDSTSVATINFINHDSSSSAATSYNFTMSAGNSSYIIIGCAAHASAARTLSSVTVNGSSAVIAVSTTGAQPVAAIAIIANVWHGQSVTMSLTFSGSMQRCAIMAWETNINDPSAHGYGASTSSSPDGLGGSYVDLGYVSQGRVHVIVSYIGNNHEATFYFNSLAPVDAWDEDVDTIFATSRRYAAAHIQQQNTGDADGIGVSFYTTASPTNPAVAFASWN